MKSAAFILLLCVGFLSGCATVPPSLTLSTDFKSFCTDIYVSPPWQITHRIRAELHGAIMGDFIGITRADRKSLRSVLLNPEGWVLLDASQREGKVTIHMARPPFDQPAMAEGLLNDVELLFLPPSGPQGSGLDRDGFHICRCYLPNGEILDRKAIADGSWRLTLFGSEGQVKTTVTASSARQEGFSIHMVLQSHVQPGYRLELELLEVNRP
jgi:hypothetical protein